MRAVGGVFKRAPKALQGAGFTRAGASLDLTFRSLPSSPQKTPRCASALEDAPFRSRHCLLVILTGRAPAGDVGDPIAVRGAAAERAAVKPRNIILMIGDGMGLAHISAARFHKGRLALEDMDHVGFSYTSSLENFVTDSSASATALASGYLILNGWVSLHPDGSPTKTVLEYAEEKGMWTGLVVTCRVTHATPACMIAHVKSRGEEQQIAEQIAAADVECILGGGWDMFLPTRTLKIDGGKWWEGEEEEDGSGSGYGSDPDHRLRAGEGPYLPCHREGPPSEADHPHCREAARRRRREALRQPEGQEEPHRGNGEARVPVHPVGLGVDGGLRGRPRSSSGSSTRAPCRRPARGALPASPR